MRRHDNFVSGDAADGIGARGREGAQADQPAEGPRGNAEASGVARVRAEAVIVPLAPRLVSTSLRDPGLYKIQSSRVGDASAGALMGLAPKTRGKQPDFFGEPLSDGEEAPEEDDGGD